MKSKAYIRNIVFFILMLLSIPYYVHSSQLVTGEITSAIILQERIHLTVGDKALTNLGSKDSVITVSYTHLRAHETPEHLVCRLLLEKKKKKKYNKHTYKSDSQIRTLKH